MMKEQNNASCSICGSPYHLCLSCKDFMKLQPWKIHCCSSECYKTFQIVKGFNNGVYTKEEAREKFKNVDLRKLNDFIPHIKKIVKDILKEEKTVETEVAAAEEIVVIDDIAVAEENIVAEDFENIVKPTVSRKRNYKEWK